MEARKVQLTGKSTYTVSLPKKWVREYNIRKGNTIGLVEKEDGALLILPEATEVEVPSEKSIEIKKGYPASLIPRLIIASYLSGYELIRLKLEHGGFEQVKEATKVLAGIEILREKEGEVVLKCLIDEKDITVNEAMDRMCSLTLQMLRTVGDPEKQTCLSRSLTSSISFP